MAKRGHHKAAVSSQEGAPQELPRGRAFIILRYTLIVAAAYLVLAEGRFDLPSVGVTVMIAAALASNVVLAMMPLAYVDSAYFAGGVILADTTWITLTLVQTGHFGADFFFLYFFVLLLAAIGESLALIAIGAVVICTANLYLYRASAGNWAFWSSPSLIRIPFYFAVAACYGFLVDRTRHERQRASEADRIKSEFLATISHELRTPLNVMLGYVDLLLDRAFGPLAAEQETALQQVQSAGRGLHRFIARMIEVSTTVSRIRAGREQIRCEELDLDELFLAVRTGLPADLKNAVDWPPRMEIPPMLTDREKLATITRNLVENAVKYSSVGTVRVEAQWDREADAVDIRVADAGIGIRRADRPHICEPFYCGQVPEDMRGSGVGLGLYVVEHFVELLHGDIHVESAEGVGSTFSVRLPRRFQDADLAPVHSETVMR
jgi:signal transduction histidine kinase